MLFRLGLDAHGDQSFDVEACERARAAEARIWRKLLDDRSHRAPENAATHVTAVASTRSDLIQEMKVAFVSHFRALEDIDSPQEFSELPAKRPALGDIPVRARRTGDAAASWTKGRCHRIRFSGTVLFEAAPVKIPRAAQ